jgi:DnaJ family protein C protein 3
MCSLDVPKSADKREIKKAYRKLAQEWHPDKYTGELDNEEVERKMAEINQAYEVLYDDGKDCD